MRVKAAILANLAVISFACGWIINGWRSGVAVQQAYAKMATMAREYEAERLRAQEQLALAVQNNRQAEQHLQAIADNERTKANEKIAISSRRADDLAARVRRAEANAATARLVSTSAQAACTGQATAGSDGSELLNSLGIEDVQEAERADKIRIAYRSCIAQYDAARAKD